MNYKYYKKSVKSWDIEVVCIQNDELTVFSYWVEDVNLTLQEIDLQEFRDICCKFNCLCANEGYEFIKPTLASC